MTTLKAPEYFDYTAREGYAWMANLSAQGWNANPEYGDWPYVVAMNRALDGKFFIKEYCEHDVKTWAYTEDERDDYAAHLAELRNEATQ